MREVVFTLMKEHPGIPCVNTIYKKPLHYRQEGEPHTAHELQGIQAVKVSVISGLIMGSGSKFRIRGAS
jgi:hypothetical protein